MSPGSRKAASTHTHTRWEESEKVEDRLRNRLGLTRGETRGVARGAHRDRTRRTRARTAETEPLRGAPSGQPGVAQTSGGARPAPARARRTASGANRARPRDRDAGAAVVAARRHGRRGERRVSRDDERLPRADGGPPDARGGLSAEAVGRARKARRQVGGGARQVGGGGVTGGGVGDASDARNHRDRVPNAKNRRRLARVAGSQGRVRERAATQTGRVRRPRAQHVRAANVQGFRRHRARAKKRGGQVSFFSTNSRGELAECQNFYPSPDAKSPDAKSPGVEPSPHSHESFDDETLAGARARTRRGGDAWLSPEPLVRRSRGAHAHADDSPGGDSPGVVVVDDERRGRRGCDGGGVGGSRDGGRRRARREDNRGSAKAGGGGRGATTAGGRARQPAGGGSGTTFPSENFRRRTSASMGTSIRNSVRVPRAAAGHYTRNPAAVPRAAMTLDDERSTTFAPRITAKASSLRRSGDFGDRMHRAAVEAANEKASVSPGATRRRGPRGVGVGTRGSGVDSGVREIHGNSWTRGDSNRGPSGDDAWGPARVNLAHAPAVSPVGTPGARRKAVVERPRGARAT